MSFKIAGIALALAFVAGCSAPEQEAPAKAVGGDVSTAETGDVAACRAMEEEIARQASKGNTYEDSTYRLNVSIDFWSAEPESPRLVAAAEDMMNHRGDEQGDEWILAAGEAQLACDELER